MFHRRWSPANPLWGASRIHGELLKLGIEVGQASVAKYMTRQLQPPSQTWRSFLRNHLGQIVAADFFVSRPRRTASGTSWSCWRTTADASCTSPSPPVAQLDRSLLCRPVYGCAQDLTSSARRTLPGSRP